MLQLIIKLLHNSIYGGVGGGGKIRGSMDLVQGGGGPCFVLSPTLETLWLTEYLEEKFNEIWNIKTRYHWV